MHRVKGARNDFQFRWGFRLISMPVVHRTMRPSDLEAIFNNGSIIEDLRERRCEAMRPIATARSAVPERSTAKQVRAHDLHTPHRNQLMLGVNPTDPS
jgi:hypothetical protein